MFDGEDPDGPPKRPDHRKLTLFDRWLIGLWMAGLAGSLGLAYPLIYVLVRR